MSANADCTMEAGGPVKRNMRVAPVVLLSASPSHWGATAMPPVKADLPSTTMARRWLRL